MASARSLVRVGNNERDTARAVALGGGMDFDLTSRFAVRVFQVDYLHTNLFSQDQNNLRFSTGLVYHWGRIKKGTPVSPRWVSSRSQHMQKGFGRDLMILIRRAGLLGATFALAWLAGCGPGSSGGGSGYPAATPMSPCPRATPLPRSG